MSLQNHCCLEQTLKLIAKLETKEIAPTVFAYRLTVSAEPAIKSFLKIAVKESISEGLALDEEIKRFTSGASDAIKTIGFCVMASDEYLNAVQKYGYATAVSKLSEEKTLSAHARSDVYTAIVDDDLPVGNLTIIDYSNDMLFHVDGTVRPSGIHFDYISARMHNGRYDLAKVLELLKNDPRVTFLITKRGSRWPERGDAVIQSIPHYNVDDERSEFLEFVYAPTEVKANDLWKQMKSYKSQYPSAERFRAMDDLDILGLAKGGALREFVAEVACGH